MWRKLIDLLTGRKELQSRIEEGDTVVAKIKEKQHEDIEIASQKMKELNLLLTRKEVSYHIGKAMGLIKE